FVIQWTNDVQPVALLLEVAFVSQDPARLRAALREVEAERAKAGESAARWLRLGDVRHDRGELPEALAAYEAARGALGGQAFRRQGVQVDDGRRTTAHRPDKAPTVVGRRSSVVDLNARTPERLTSAILEARIGQTLLELGKPEEAEAAFRRSLANLPGAARAE